MQVSTLKAPKSGRIPILPVNANTTDFTKIIMYHEKKKLIQDYFSIKLLK